MNGCHGHSRLLSRHSFRGALVCDTAVHVGTGDRTDVFATSDMPVARDGAGRPYIPGSSFRGAFRAGLESLLRGLEGGDSPVRVCDPLRQEGTAEPSCSERVRAKRQQKKSLTEDLAFRLAWDESCPVCRIFGHSFLASRVWIGDLKLSTQPDKAQTYLRDGVGLDRDLRSAAKGILYNFEAVPADARFDLRLEVENAEDHELGLLLTGLGLFEDGFIGIGGKRARGLGMASIRDLLVTRKVAGDFFRAGEEAAAAGAALDPKALAACRRRAHEHYVEGRH